MRFSCLFRKWVSNIKDIGILNETKHAIAGSGRKSPVVLKINASVPMNAAAPPLIKVCRSVQAGGLSSVMGVGKHCPLPPPLRSADQRRQEGWAASWVLGNAAPPPLRSAGQWRQEGWAASWVLGNHLQLIVRKVIFMVELVINNNNNNNNFNWNKITRYNWQNNKIQMTWLTGWLKE